MELDFLLLVVDVKLLINQLLLLCNDPTHQFRDELCNLEMVELVHLETDDQHELKGLIKNHIDYTESSLGQEIIKDWEVNKMDFIKVFPTDYRLALERLAKEKQTKLTA